MTMHNKEELPNIFNEMRISVYAKAAQISAEDLGMSADSLKKNNYGLGSTFNNNLECIANESYWNGDFFTSVQKVSTPKLKSFRIKPSRKLFSNEPSSNKYLFKKSNQLYNENGDETPVFSPEKLLQISEKERFLTVEKVMKERIQSMQESDRLMHDSFEHLWQAKLEEESAKRLLSEQKILDDIHEQELKNRPKREEKLAEDNKRNAQRELDRIQRVKDAENEARKKSEYLKLQKKLRDKILECQKEYGDQYREVYSIITSCENKNKLSEKSSSTMKELKNLSTEYDSLFKKTKTMELSEDDVNNIVKVVEMMKELCKTLKKEVEDINVEEKKVPEEKVQEVKKKEPVKHTEATKSTDEPVSDLSDCFDSQSFQTYMSLKTYLESFDKSCKNLMEDGAMKKFKFTCQKAVTMPVNAISPISGSHLSDKYFKLHSLLSGKVVEVGGIQISASQHPEGICYCKKLLAKKFVRQGDLTVSSKPDAAFSIAAVLASLWIDFPDFGQLTLAYFQNACPYLAPVFMPQVEGQSVEDYHRSLGYQYTENGEVEKQDSFLKRMSGIMRLYAAVLITKVRQPGKRNPLGIAEGWRWMAALLNLEPRPDICATLLYDFLEVAGNEMFKTYGAQFKKLLAYICQVYYPKLEKITPASSGGPLVRLEEFLQKIMKNERIPPPEGLLPNNFW